VAAALLAVTALAQQKQRELTPQAIQHIQAGLQARQENRLEDEVRDSKSWWAWRQASPRPT
jgi:hypothetical protein